MSIFSNWVYNNIDVDSYLKCSKKSRRRSMTIRPPPGGITRRVNKSLLTPTGATPPLRSRDTWFAIAI